MFGRENDFASIRELLIGGARLVTITGSAGVGKTRLAVAVGDFLVDHFEGSVYFVDLAAVRHTGLVVSSMAAALALPVPPGAQGALDAFLGAPSGQRPTLLVLDNFEQVIDAGPDVAHILAYCPWLQIVVTSRERLRLRGEQDVEILPLPVPQTAPEPDPALVRDNPAVALFVHSTRAVLPGFEVEPVNVTTLVQLIQRLEGVPLAIELAAGHMNVLSASEVLSRLRQPLDALDNGPRDLPERQQTLRSALDWSYRLLDAQEQHVFNVLSVCRGGCDVASLAAIAGVANVSEILPTVRSLMDKSLVMRVEQHDPPRLAMLEYVREYAAEQLDHAGGGDVARAAHARRFAELAADGGRELGAQGGQAKWLTLLEADHDNLRAALEWTLIGSEPGRRATALTMAVSLAEFWFIRGYFEEGVQWLHAAMDGAGDDEKTLFAAALAASGRIAFGQGRYEEARGCYQEAIDRARRSNLRAELAAALAGLAEVHAYLGTYGPALDLLRDSAQIREELGDAAGHARVTNSLGLVHLHQGRNQEALSLFEQGVALFRDLDDTWGMAWSLSNTADAERALGQSDLAEVHYTQALEVARDIGLNAAMAAALEGLSALDVSRGSFVAAARRYSAAAAIRESIGSSTSPTRRAALERLLDTARTALGTDQFELAWAEGRSSPTWGAGATEPALHTEPTPHSAVGAPTKISSREQEVAVLVARGLTNRRLARELGISENTVGRHLENIYRKLGVRSRTELTAWGFNGGLPELTHPDFDAPDVIEVADTARAHPGRPA